jgi:hypothetical protein
MIELLMERFKALRMVPNFHRVNLLQLVAKILYKSFTIKSLRSVLSLIVV